MQYLKIALSLNMFILVWSSDLTAQPRKIFLQIDTIDYYDKHELIGGFKVKVGGQGIFPFGVNFDSTQSLDISGYPNYSNNIILESDSSTIRLPVDLNGSYI